ncbi:hypothetical protein GALMADRAFT_142686 [Galerina marginata CBS 339.88]|uniref:Uncharacterized protein n=1 Tax=Galerina marginata (strain CBS 339.88) TaxID=685588 RepID=A0A067SPY6_GALM3|nr:hypothetical protein GALMADRAFT_142686 [Galerina marginata CBS 339.88]
MAREARAEYLSFGKGPSMQYVEALGRSQLRPIEYPSCRGELSNIRLDDVRGGFVSCPPSQIEVFQVDLQSRDDGLEQLRKELFNAKVMLEAVTRITLMYHDEVSEHQKTKDMLRTKDAEIDRLKELAVRPSVPTQGSLLTFLSGLKNVFYGSGDPSNDPIENRPIETIAASAPRSIGTQTLPPPPPSPFLPSSPSTTTDLELSYVSEDLERLDPDATFIVSVDDEDADEEPIDPDATFVVDNEDNKEESIDPGTTFVVPVDVKNNEEKATDSDTTLVTFVDDRKDTSLFGDYPRQGQLKGRTLVVSIVLPALPVKPLRIVTFTMLKSLLEPSKVEKMSKLLEKKLKYEAERDALDEKIIEVKLQYTLIHNSCVPLLVLPTEVTCMIFQHAMVHPVEDDSEEGRVPWSEVIISHVCRQWRSISLAYPRLWGCFCYDDRDSSPERLDTYLQRSTTHNLDLWFDFRAKSGDAEDYSPLLEKILPHTRRWKYVTILSDTEDVVSTFVSNIESVFAPNLVHFALCCGKSYGRQESFFENLEPTIFVKGAPKLKSATFHWSTIPCIPPLSQITSLCLETQSPLSSEPYFSWTAFLQVLMLPSLEELSLAGDVFEPSVTSMTGVISMAKLVHLRCFEYGLSCWLPYLRAPLLETLSVKNDIFTAEDFEMSPEPYVFPSIRSVSLIRIRASPQAVGHLARMTEAATELLFSQDDISRGFLSVPHNSEELDDQTYWTKVDTLTCSSADMRNRAVLLRFAKARAKNNLCLRWSKRWDMIWRHLHAADYATLTSVCTIETLNREDGPLCPRWPPGEHNPDHLHDHEAFHDGPFDIFHTALN